MHVLILRLLCLCYTCPIKLAIGPTFILSGGGHAQHDPEQNKEV